MSPHKSSLMIAGAATLWGVSSTIAKALFNVQLDPVLVVQCRASFSFLMLAAYCLVARRELFRIPLRDVWPFVLLGIVGVAGTNFTYYFTIQQSTVATAIIIQYTSPLFVIAYAVISGREKVTPVKIGAALAALLGCALAVGAYNPSVMRLTPLALLTGIGSILGFAFLTIYTQTLRQTYSVWTILLYALGSASVFWLVVHPPLGGTAAHLTTPVWGTLVVLAILSVLLPYLLFWGALRSVEPSRAIITSTLEPIVAIASAAVFLGELLEGLQIVGSFIVIGAIVLLQFHPEASHAKK
jgi:drug/metabolite transporter (DMT)-like permease